MLEMAHTQNMTLMLKEFSERTKIGSEKMREEHRCHLRRNLQREYENIKGKNNTEKTEAKRKAMEIKIQTIASYEKSMEKFWITLGEGNYVDDDAFNRLHTDNASIAMKVFVKSSDVHGKFKSEFKEKLQEEIKKSREKFRKLNADERRIAEEKDEGLKFLMTSVLDSAKYYKEAMRKNTTYYSEDEVIGMKHRSTQSDTLDYFEMKVISSSHKVSKEQLNKYKNECKDKISDEYEEIKRSNKIKKELLEQTLKSQREQACDDHREFFSKQLKDTWMEPGELLRLDKEVMSAKMRALEKSIEGIPRTKIIKDHLAEVKHRLHEEYGAVYERNKENGKWYNKFLRGCKEIGSAAWDFIKSPIDSIRSLF